MPARPRAIDAASSRGREAIDLLVGEIERGRRQHGLSLEVLANSVGLSRWQLGRLLDGERANLSILAASRLLAAVGLDLAVRTYPAGDPIRDAAHLALLERLRSRLHASLRWWTEVPLPIPGDRRAWDALIRATDWSLGVEAETRLRDLQALERRVALKARDGGVDGVLLLLADTRHHRTILRSAPGGLAQQFPIEGHRALELLAAAVNPGGSSLILL